MDNIYRALFGAGIALLISGFSKTKFFFVAGLVPLFPTFALLAHVVVHQERSIEDLKSTILFGMLSLIPYFAYLLSMYFLVGRMPFWVSALSSVALWCVVALPLVYMWRS